MIGRWIFPKLRVRMHTGFVTEKDQTNAYVFFTITNLSRHEVEITHTWLQQHRNIQTAILNPQRPLPKRLRPQEVWETWFPFIGLAFVAHEKWWYLGRARLSTGEIYKSKWDENIPQVGGIGDGAIPPPAASA